MQVGIRITPSSWAGAGTELGKINAPQNKANILDISLHVTYYLVCIVVLNTVKYRSP